MGELAYMKIVNKDQRTSGNVPVLAGQKMQLIVNGVVVLDWTIADNGQIDYNIQAVAVKKIADMTASQVKTLTQKYVIIEQSESAIPIQQGQMPP